jgi:hypothetical protein
MDATQLTACRYWVDHGLQSRDGNPVASMARAIVGTTATPGLSGHVANTDRKCACRDQTGTYNIKNYPEDGMGVFQGTCAVHEFVLRNVDSNGLAHGFNFILTKRKKGCKDNGASVAGGGGGYQGPLK